MMITISNGYYDKFILFLKYHTFLLTIILTYIIGNINNGLSKKVRKLNKIFIDFQHFLKFKQIKYFKHKQTIIMMTPKYYYIRFCHLINSCKIQI